MTEPTQAMVKLADELKPCPFCGGECEIERAFNNFEDARVSCKQCGVAGPVFDNDALIGAFSKNPEADATTHWNTRLAAAPAASGGVRERTINECADALAQLYPDNASTNAFCAAIRSLITQSAPALDSSHNIGERLPPSDVAEAGADTKGVESDEVFFRIGGVIHEARMRECYGKMEISSRKKWPETLKDFRRQRMDGQPWIDVAVGQVRALAKSNLLALTAPPLPADEDCEDQGLFATERCTICRVGFDQHRRPIYPKLERRGKFWCCPRCGSSYGENPHPNCPALTAPPLPADGVREAREKEITRLATIEECAQLIESGAGMADLIDQEELDEQAKMIRTLAAPHEQGEG